jgi:hypothetical protein
MPRKPGSESDFGGDPRKAGNERLASRQFPVGWLFFSYKNVETLLGQFRPLLPSVTFGDIQKVMQKYYRAYGLNERIACNDATGAAQKKVDELNAVVVKAFTESIAGGKRGRARYSRFVRQPIIPGTWKRIGQFTSVRDRSMIANRGKFEDIESKLRSAPSAATVNTHTSHLQSPAFASR